MWRSLAFSIPATGYIYSFFVPAPSEPASGLCACTYTAWLHPAERKSNLQGARVMGSLMKTRVPF